MTQRTVGDTTRSLICAALAAAVGVGAALPAAIRLGPEGLTGGELGRVLIPSYLVAWPAFVLLYLGWTHVAYSRCSPRGLEIKARREAATRKTRWSRWIGMSGGSNSTLAAALIAIAIVVAIAQDPTYRSEFGYVLGGLLSVGFSWALMAYSFALEYLQLNVDRRDDGEPHIAHRLDGPMRFGDYLTLTVLLSVMGATTSAEPNSRPAWRLVRTHVVFAFVFNSVIVAMMVSLLFGGIAG